MSSTSRRADRTPARNIPRGTARATPRKAEAVAVPAPASVQQREAQVQQALIELFPHLRTQAYNALREMFPSPAKP